MPVRAETTADTTVLTIDNPPVNAIGARERRDLQVGLRRALEANARRIIVTGAGRHFAAGADVKEFDADPVEPHLPDVLREIEGAPAPVIAAINGTALGAGLEIALACHYRIAGPPGPLGLPEVTLGVVPGAGGTQRLPRIVGIAAALPIATLGQTVTAEAARGIGLIDAVSSDPLAAALDLPVAELRRAEPAARRAQPTADPDAVDDTRALARRRMRGQEAPGLAIDLVAATAELPFDDGLRREREVFLGRRGSSQARALRHVFFAERRANRLARTIEATPAPVDHAVVVGGGSMGASIAYALAEAGIGVSVIETDAQALDRARRNVKKLYDQAVKRRKTSADKAAETLASRFEFTIGYDRLPRADIAIEAAFEDLDVKQEIFTALDAALPDDAVLATNTSYLDVNRIAEVAGNPSRVLGLHFFSPAHVMKLVEVVRTDDTSDGVLATSLELAHRLGKIPVLSGVCDGFIGNRILTRYRQTTDIVMLEGSTPWQIDAAMREFGFAMGPYEVQDLSGLDIAHANRKRLGLKERADYRYIPIADRVVDELGRLGRKSGAGWYDYPEGTSPRPSPPIEDLIEETARREGITRRAFDPEEIRERALAAMIDEACRILDEGIAAEPRDIDLVLVHGYAFPKWRGGLMHFADTIGPRGLVQRLEALAAEDPLSWSIPPLVRRLVRDGRTFGSLDDQAD